MKIQRIVGRESQAVVAVHFRLPKISKESL